MKDQLGKIVMKISVVLRAKTYSYLIDDDTENKKAKETKKCVRQRNFKFENCINCLEAIQFGNKINHLQKKNEIDIDCLKKDNKEFKKQ